MIQIKNAKPRTDYREALAYASIAGLVAIGWLAAGLVVWSVW